MEDAVLWHGLVRTAASEDVEPEQASDSMHCKTMETLTDAVTVIYKRSVFKLMV